MQKKEQIKLQEVRLNALFEGNTTVLSHSRCYKYYIRGYKNDANDNMEAILVNSSTFIALSLLDSLYFYSVFVWLYIQYCIGVCLAQVKYLCQKCYCTKF